VTDVAAASLELASDAVTLTPVSTAPTADAVVTVCKSPIGAHVGLSYRIDDTGTRRHLHLAFHFRLQNDEAPEPDALWVAPRIDEFALSDIRASAELIARQHKDGLVPYAFQKGAARFSVDGVLELNGSLGLTCATFLELVFARAHVPLLDAATWDEGRSPERRAEDEAAQRRLVQYLRQTAGAAKHADLVEKEIPCTRVRAEEVAAASGMTRHPITFARAEPEGARILAAVQAPRKPCAPEVPSPPETTPRKAEASRVESATEA
jgi:hypothetical protein